MAKRYEVGDEVVIADNDAELLAKLRERGLVKATDPKPAYVLVGSDSRPGEMHQVALSCSCRGFQYNRYCKHLARGVARYAVLRTSVDAYGPANFKGKDAHVDHRGYMGGGRTR